MLTLTPFDLNLFGISIEHENTEVHPLGKTPKVIVVSTEAGERDSKLQSDTSLNNDPGQGKPIEKNMEETDLQGTMQYQLEKQDSLKKGMCMLTLLHNSIV